MGQGRIAGNSINQRKVVDTLGFSYYCLRCHVENVFLGPNGVESLVENEVSIIHKQEFVASDL